MICPKCKEEGKKSKVYSGGGRVTLMGSSGMCFWDENGVQHSHDPNTFTRNYRCSRGHEWTTKSKAPCPNCDYGHGSERVTYKSWEEK